MATMMPDQHHVSEDSVLCRRLELLGDQEYLRRLRRPTWTES